MNEIPLVLASRNPPTAARLPRAPRKAIAGWLRVSASAPQASWKAASTAKATAAARLALCGGVALYLAGHVGFALRMIGTVGWAKLAAAAAVLAVFALGGGLPAWAALAAVAAVVVVLCAAESARAPA